MTQERVTVLDGPLQGQTFDLNGALSIGRDQENDIFLDDREVSRSHAVIEKTPAGVILRDLDSGNGVYVGSRRILEYRLSQGKVFRIGSIRLRFESKRGTPSTGDSVVWLKDEQEGHVEATGAENLFRTLFISQPDTKSKEELRETRKRLAAIYEANQIISTERELRKLFERVLEQVFKLVPANNGVLLIPNEESGDLETAYERIESGDSEIRISSSIVKQAYDNGEAVLVYDAASDDRFDGSESIEAGNIASAMCIPLIHQGEILGAIYLDTRGTTNAFTQKDRDLVLGLMGPAALAIRNAQYTDQLEREFQTSLKLLANAIELRDHYTLGHTWRVTNFAIAIAEEMGWDEERLKMVEMGGVLHDIGKIAVEDAILRKPGKLTDEEYEQMKIHPEAGANLMKDSSRLQPLIPFCLYHHERFDGKGYPSGLKGEEIPIEGRVLAVADAFDAMTSDRPYRKGLDPETAIEEIEKCKHTQFDPDCADAFIRVYNAGNIDHILRKHDETDSRGIVCPFCSAYIAILENCCAGEILNCGVCHRSIKVIKKNEEYYGVRVTEADLEAIKKDGRSGA